MIGKKKNRLAKCAVAIVLAFSLIAIPSYQPVAGASDLSSRQEDLKRQKEEAQAALEEARKKTEDQQAQKDAIDENIRIVQEQIDANNEQLDLLDGQIREKEEQISGKQAEIDQKFDTLKQRLCEIYMAGDTSTLEIILGAKSFSDLLDKAEMVKYISQHDSELINGLRESLAGIQAEKDSIEADRSQVEEKKQELDSQRAELDALLAESNALLEQLQGEQQAAQDSLNETDSELQQIEQEIQEYYANQQQSAASSGDSVGNITVGAGGLVWPTPSFHYLSSYWGDGRNHGAIDISGSGIYGSPVVSAASGTVIKAYSGGWGGGYGNHIMIDHGNGMMTVYGHLSSVDVSTGQSVSAGQVIGRVGNTGQSTGPHLHFEVRINGVKQNPLNWY